MSRSIVIIDFSLGNLFSVQQAFKHCGAEVKISHDKSTIETADALVLPGVGAFAEAMKNLHAFELTGIITEAIHRGKPFLGICLGMQLLFDGSEEFGNCKGLGILPGVIRKFQPSESGQPLHVPQIAWNTIHQPAHQNWAKTALKGIPSGEFMYFVHSYYALPSRKENILCETTYGINKYCSAVTHGNLFATQFHPEKSGKKGIAIYQNWLTKI